MVSRKLPNMNLEGVVAVHWKDVPPKELVYPGFSTRILWHGLNGRRALIFEIAPGAVYPDLDVHAPGAEEVFVVSGIFCDGKNTYPAGTFIHHPAGTSHIPQSTDGCMLFVFFPEG
jgi:anti-sigma factor ChrR (cupin superfamily)